MNPTALNPEGDKDTYHPPTHGRQTDRGTIKQPPQQIRTHQIRTQPHNTNNNKPQNQKQRKTTPRKTLGNK